MATAFPRIWCQVLIPSRNRKTQNRRGAPACAPSVKGGHIGPPLRENCPLIATWCDPIKLWGGRSHGGGGVQQDFRVGYLPPEARVPKDHPRRPRRQMVNSPDGSFPGTSRPFTPGRGAPPSRRRSCCGLCSCRCSTHPQRAPAHGAMGLPCFFRRWLGLAMKARTPILTGN